jgi:CHAD domain-containing protein
MWVHLDRLLARQPALRDPERPDELRKYRVAIRRLRAAVRMFADAYPGREIKPIRRGLADLAGAVGQVRDLDHRIAHLNLWALERGDASRTAALPLLAAWGDERGRAIAALHDRIETRRHRRLVLALIEFVDQPSTTGRPARFAGPSTVGDRLASSLWAAYEEVRAFGPVVRWADLETLHDLRIATKRFRDGIEFLAGVLGPERQWLLVRLVALQDHLGALNDAAVAAIGVRRFLEDRHAQLAALEQAEIAAYLADREREIARLRRTTPQRWRPVAGVLFARRLSRLVVTPAGAS